MNSGFNNTTLKVLALLIFAGLIYSCGTEIEKPAQDSEAYRQAVSDFYVSLSAVQADQLLFAAEKMETITEKYPDEAAAWANLAVFAMRQANFNLAEERISEALDRSPDNADITFLAGIIESRRGNVNASVDYLRSAADLKPDDLQIAYALVEELERQDDIANADEVFSILNSILEQEPDNLAILLEMVRFSVKREEMKTLEEAMSTLSDYAGNWPEDIQRQFNQISQTILEDESANLTFQLAFLRNNLNQLPKFQSDLRAVQIPPNQVGFLITEFTWLPQPENAAAQKDDQLAFTFELMSEESGVEMAKPISLSDLAESDWVSVKGGTAVINGKKNLPFPGEARTKEAITTIDFNYDFMNDLAFAGSQGFRLYRQEEDSSFTDVTGSLGLSREYLDKSYKRSWSADIDLDGDLDLVMNPTEQPVVVLRNNGDDTFEVIDLFSQFTDPVAFLWADFDGDTDPDAAFLNADGSITVLINERSGRFTEVADLPVGEEVIDIEVSDIDSDTQLDLLAWDNEGIQKIYYNSRDGSWNRENLVEFTNSPSGEEAGAGHLIAADLDNSGSNDILAVTDEKSYYWLSDENLNIDSAASETDGGVLGLADFNGDTRLDMIALNSEGQTVLGVNSGGKDYLARIIRPRASGSLGDRRINSFGIGGEIEIRSGLLYQKQPIEQPWVHLGLGTYDEAEVLRIIWPNGSSQSEFAELGYDSKIFNEQVLKGSCPWVFTYNGNEMEFVTDFLWRTGLGIRINAQGSADVIHSVDWIKVDGDQLKPKNGFYDVRITADLWETHFFDHVSLKAVDHPVGTEVFVDERFSFPPAQPSIHLLKNLKPVAGAINQDGRNVTDKISDLDQKYVDGFKLTKYQGIAEEHFLEVDLGNEVSGNDKLKLVASGWIYPTDTSVNIAISQGSQQAPSPLSLHVPDGQGGWKVAKENIGFPAGKSKTMVIDLEGIFEEGTERRVRLVTNMEIYWNRVLWGVEADSSEIIRKDLKYAEADLRYRGFSRVERPSRFVPEIPDYQTLQGTTPMWSDLEGHYTRFGPVGELIEEIDDRYVIMNAGDEMVFKFPALSEPEPGMDRDFVLVGDGWVKDGDYNTGYSTTVLPLPYHGMEDYSEAPGRLEDDPVFQKFPADWVHYHTRYVTPRDFRTALKFDKE
ncbi:hypothetical protein G3570_08250 [Balneolaceae bacterium YR4-1]|uniref:Uncharacterized protein n=1 Tax=Halalkalibaculum roseum TaxID=2709311 RepID=A0A6M1SMQ7_9BACT|nr:CRTAC1 family protein [Halalkalibaculum roseum]NGP76621.1 hypothetical protein [Halalkalibaculum roseum]